ncbi:Thymidylate kinase [Enhygromyxa salina]|uniref:Thymidylate kinase n=1 Tax=Enhygromyxa salina TaxID=215803 RepID=A0A2S9YLD0_9BACT|nr:dTMP kinase [Enhygromyxa salina]PRQ05878.1 Thymidylate kinase [Enhygromyxa salina]
MTRATPRIIAFEGVDGAGKSTVIRIVAEHLRARGERVFLPREGKEHRSRPTRMIRRLTRDRRNVALEPVPELLLYAAREAQVLEEHVRPALARGEIVLLDRSLVTPMVMGVHGRGVDPGVAARIVDAASGGLEPELTLIFDVDPRTSRIRKRLDKIRTQRFRDGGRKGLAGSGFKVRVRDGYLELARERQLVVVHAERGTPAEVGARVCALLDSGTFTEPDDAGRPWWRVDPDASFEDALAGLPDLVALYFSRRMAIGRELRARLYERHPRLVAWAADLDDPLWPQIDRELPATRIERMSIRPLAETPWRTELAESFPAEVARSLRGIAGEAADALRTRLVAHAPGPVVESLSGRSDAFAVELRKRLWKQANIHERAYSLELLTDPWSVEKRRALLDEDPGTVLPTLRGLAPELADPALEAWADKAPKAVLSALMGRADDSAHRLRRELIETGREVVDSIRGLDDPASWALREACVDRWPSTVAWSLDGLLDVTPARCRVMIEACRDADPGDLFMKRRLYLLELRDQGAGAGGGADA